jgi:hypothetical protein
MKYGRGNGGRERAMQDRPQAEDDQPGQQRVFRVLSGHGRVAGRVLSMLPLFLGKIG